MRHIILAGGILALTGCGSMKPEARPEPEGAFTCRGRPPPPRSILGRMIGALRGAQSLSDGQPEGDTRPDESPGVELAP
jgi:hypothetical protein